MYKLTTTKGVDLCLTDEIVYIKLSKNGTLIPADEDTAVGIACNGMPYNLIGHTEIKEADTVTITEVNGGNILEKASMSTADNTEMLIDLQYQFDIASLGGM